MAEVGSLFVRLRAEASEFEKTMESVGSKLRGTGKDLKDVGGDVTKYVTAPITAVGVGSTLAAIDFESAFAGVRKTVDGSEDDFKRLETGILDMSEQLPASAAEIAGVAEAAGQLGIETDNILDFTRVMIDLGEATNMSSDQAASSLARLANITGMPQDKFSNLGSSVVELGNNFATTEQEIVDMSLRLAGAGSQIGLSEAEILGIATALSSVGIEAEAGGSAFSRVMVDIASAVANGGEELDMFAEVAGMSTEDFARLFEEDAAGAVIAFTEGLGRISDEGGNVFGVLEALGLDQIRVRDALLRSAGAGDLMRDSIEMSTNAWEDNTALTKEAEQRYNTTASQLAMVKNQAMAVAIQLGKQLLPVIKNDIIPAVQSFIQMVSGLVSWFSKLSPTAQKVILIIAGIAAAIGPVLVVAGTLGIMLGGLATGIAVLGTVMAAVLSPIGLIVIAIAALVAAFVIAYQESETFRDIVHGAIDAVKVVIEEVVGLVTNLIDGDWTAAWERASGWVTSAKDAIVEALPGIWEAIQTFVTETVPKIATELATWAWEFIAWVGPQIPPLLLELGKLLNDLGNWIVLTALPEIGKKLAKWAWEFISWVGPQIPPLLLELGYLLKDMGDWIITTALPELVTKLADWGSAFIEWVAKDALPFLRTELGKITKDMFEWITETALPGIKKKLVEWGTAFVGWVATDAIPFIGEKLGNFLTTITDWIVDEGIPGLVGGAKDLGTNLVEGIWEGIKSSTSWLVDKLKEWVDDAIPGPVKAALELLSPSRVMARIGEDIPRGLAVGIEDELSAVMDSANRMATAVVTGFDPPELQTAGFAGTTMTPNDPRFSPQDATLRPTFIVRVGERELQDIIIETSNRHYQRVQ